MKWNKVCRPIIFSQKIPSIARSGALVKATVVSIIRTLNPLKSAWEPRVRRSFKHVQTYIFLFIWTNSFTTVAHANCGAFISYRKTRTLFLQRKYITKIWYTYACNMEIEVSWDCHVLGSNKQAGGYPQAWFRAWYHPLPKLRTY